jgi:D-alanyl-D-alanine carboxypeptidase
MTVKHAFEIASVTKTFTAVCVLQLQESGQLDLDEPIGHYLSSRFTNRLLVIDGHDYGSKITVRQLLNHTSGLPDYWSDGPYVRAKDNRFLVDFEANPQRFWEPEEILQYTRRLAPVGVPGKRYHYSDTNYTLLGLMLEQITHETLAEVYRKRLFVQLKMDQTYLSYREQPRAGVAESHRYEDHLDLFRQRRQSADWASGGLVSTVADLGRFVAALEQGRLFRHPETLREMEAWVDTEKPSIAYGLGLFRIDLRAGRGQLIGHDGHGNAFMYYWPERQVALLGTLNQTGNDWWPMVVKVLRALERDCGWEPNDRMSVE